MAWLNEVMKKFRNYPISDEELDDTIATFEKYFWEYSEKNDYFSDEVSVSSTNPEESAVLFQLKKIKKEDLDKIINELKNSLKYNFFTYIWEKKENLKLIRELNELSEEIENKIKQQNEELLNLEKIKQLIEQNKIKKTNQDDMRVIDVKDYFSFFNFLSEKINNNVSFLKDINFSIFNNKKNFLTESRELRNKVTEEIDKLQLKNEELEKKNEKIFEKLFKEQMITQLILFFWAFRMKNNNDEYKIHIEDKELKTKLNKNFSFFFQLIDVIFVRYIKKIIKNEEKIYNDIFEKYNNQKNEFLNEQKNIIEINNEVKEKLEKFKASLATKNQQVVTYQNEIGEQRKQIKNLEQRKKKIKTKKITYLQDVEEHKNDLENQILINDNLESRKAKKQYLNNIVEKIKNIENDIKEKNNKIIDLKDDIKRDNTEIDIHTDKIKKNEEKINRIESIFKENKYMMVYEIKKLKEKWIKNISTDQKTFINFFKKINKLEDIKFIEFIENYWEREKENMIVLNEPFNVENNLQSIKEQNEKIGSELRNIFENLEINFKLKEQEIIKNAIKETKEKFQEYWREINESKLVSIETQTEINQKDEKTSWQEQKLEDQDEKIEQLQLQVDDLENKLILIKREHEDEVNDLSQRLENIWKDFMKQNETTKKECERLKSNLDKKIKKTRKEQEIKDQLIVEEIKLTCIEEILKLIGNQMPTLQQPLLHVISNGLIKTNLDNTPTSSSSTPKINGPTC